MSNNPAHTDEWNKLAAYKEPVMTDLFAADPDRAARYTLSYDGLTLDCSKNTIDDDILADLLSLARRQKVEHWRDQMFAGERINTTENRAVLHTALRRPPDDTLNIDDENIMPFIHGELARMKIFCQKIHDKEWRGYSGNPIDTIVNIGIGGSDLGPHMVCEALKAYARPGLSVHFVSNVDGTHIAQTLARCRPDTTLFLVASKTFTTQETMANAKTARDWLIDAGGEKAIAAHFAALSTNEKAVGEFGIDPANMFAFRDWVGGRYSLWSPIGLSIALSIGFDKFEALLAGARAMDTHFCTAPLEGNMPVWLALIGIWHRNFCARPAGAVLPYDQNLHCFPAFLQQLDMESNGKRVDRAGNPITDYETGPIIFGEPGTNGQHAFYQLIHQGTTPIPCDFIAAKHSNYPTGRHHNLLLNNMLAQGQALMQGRPLSQAGGNPHRAFPGNRSSTTLLLDRLDPYHLGLLIALYEHKIFVQGIIWNINSFDQYGVELGKELAARLEQDDTPSLDPSTLHLKNLLDRA